MANDLRTVQIDPTDERQCSICFRPVNGQPHSHPTEGYPWTKPLWSETHNEWVVEHYVGPRNRHPIEQDIDAGDPGPWINGAWHCHRHPTIALGRIEHTRQPDGRLVDQCARRECTHRGWIGALGQALKSHCWYCPECNAGVRTDERLAAPPVHRLLDPFKYRGGFDYPMVQCRRARFSLPSESAITEVREHAQHESDKFRAMGFITDEQRTCRVTYDNLVAAADAALAALKMLRDLRRVERRVVIRVYGKHKGECITYERGIVRRPISLPESTEPVALDVYLRAITPTISRGKVDALLRRFKPEWVGQRFEEFLSSLPERLQYEQAERASIDDEVGIDWGGEEGDGTDTNGSAKHRSTHTEMMPDYEGFGYHPSPSSAEFKFAQKYASVLQKIHIASHGVPHLFAVRRRVPLCPEDIDALMIETPDAVEGQIICLVPAPSQYSNDPKYRDEFRKYRGIFPMRQTPPNYLALQPDEQTPSVTYYEGKIKQTLRDVSADVEYEPEPDKQPEHIDPEYERIREEKNSIYVEPNDTADTDTLTEMALSIPAERIERAIIPELASIADLFKHYQYGKQPDKRSKSIKLWSGALPWWRVVPEFPSPLWPKSSIQLLPLNGRASKEEWRIQRAWEKQLRASPEVKALQQQENKIWRQFVKQRKFLKGKWDESLYDLFMQATDLQDKQQKLCIEAALDGLFKAKHVWSRHDLTTTRVTSGTEEEQRDRNIHAAAEIGKFQQVICIVPRSKLAQEDVIRHLRGELSAEEVLERNPGTTAKMLKQARHNLRKHAAKKSNPEQRWAQGLKNAKIDPDAPGIYALAQFFEAKEWVYKIADVGDSDDAIWEKFDERVNELVDTYIRKKGLRKIKTEIKTEICDLYRYIADQPLTDKYIAVSVLYIEYASQLAVPTEWRVQPASESQLRALQARRHVLNLFYRHLSYLGFDLYLGIDLSSL